MFKKIGLRIRKVRLSLNIKQKDLARKIGISQGALTNFELGRRKISLEWLVKISRALETPVSYFLVDVEPQADAKTLGSKELRLVRSFQKMAADAKLQNDVLHVMDRMGRHLERKGARGRRSR
jgi:transcriptional regulator with XRE-family HTH domain